MSERDNVRARPVAPKLFPTEQVSPSTRKGEAEAEAVPEAPAAGRNVADAPSVEVKDRNKKKFVAGAAKPPPSPRPVRADGRAARPLAETGGRNAATCPAAKSASDQGSAPFFAQRGEKVRAADPPAGTGGLVGSPGLVGGRTQDAQVAQQGPLAEAKSWWSPDEGAAGDTKGKAEPVIAEGDLGVPEGFSLPGKGSPLIDEAAIGVLGHGTSVAPKADEIGTPGSSDGSARPVWAQPRAKDAQQGAVWAASEPIAAPVWAKSRPKSDSSQAAPPTPAPADTREYPSIRPQAQATDTSTTQAYPYLPQGRGRVRVEASADTTTRAPRRAARPLSSGDGGGGRVKVRVQEDSSGEQNEAYALLLASMKKIPEIILENKGQPTSPDVLPPPLWYAALGTLMQGVIADAMTGTRTAGRYMAHSNELQELRARLTPLHEENSREHPRMEDILKIMGYTARHIARYYKRQCEELGFDNTVFYNEVGFVHDYKNYYAARRRIHARLEDKREGMRLAAEDLIYLADPRSQATLEDWMRITKGDKQLWEDLQTVALSSVLYRDPRDKRQYYLAPDGVKPDFMRILTKNDEKDDELPDLLGVVDKIIRGSENRRNLQDFRWVNERIVYRGEETTYGAVLDRFFQRLAAGNVHIIIDEVKTHIDDFSKFHNDIEFAHGHKPEPGAGLRNTNLEADISGTSRVLLNFLKNLGYSGKEIAAMAQHITVQFTEVGLRALKEGTLDKVHAQTANIGYPVPVARTYGMTLRELARGWRRRTERVIRRGQIEVSKIRQKEGDKVKKRRKGPMTLFSKSEAEGT